MRSGSLFSGAAGLDLAVAEVVLDRAHALELRDYLTGWLQRTGHAT